MDPFEDDRQAREADRMVAATLYLMSCHARSQCPRLACMVEQHLKLLGRHPGAGEQVRHLCARIAAAWVAVRRHDERLKTTAPDSTTLH